MPRESAAFLPARTRRCAARIRPQQSQRELAVVEYLGWFKHTGPHETLAMSLEAGRDPAQHPGLFRDLVQHEVRMTD